MLFGSWDSAKNVIVSDAVPTGNGKIIIDIKIGNFLVVSSSWRFVCLALSLVGFSVDFS